MAGKNRNRGNTKYTRQPGQKTVPGEFEGTPEQYIQIAKMMESLPGGYSGRQLIKSFGRLIEEDDERGNYGWNLLPVKDKRGQWSINRVKDVSKVNTEGRAMTESIPDRVKKDILENYGPEELKKFTKWVTSGLAAKEFQANLITAFTDKKYDKGHWSAIQKNFTGHTAPWNWDWVGRTAHVGLNLDPEIAKENRRRGNKADPSEQFLVNAGVPRNWMEAFIYYKDSQGLANRKEIGLGSKRLGDIAAEEQLRLQGSEDAPQLAPGDDRTPTQVMEDQVNTLAIQGDTVTQGINKAVARTNTLALAMQGAEAVLSGDYNEGAIKALQAVAPMLPAGMGNITQLASLVLEKGQEEGVEPFSSVPDHTRTDDQRRHDVNMEQYREGLGQSHEYLSEVLREEDRQREIDYKTRVNALDFGITERIDHLFGGQGMTQEQVDEAENQEENLQSRLQNNKNFLSTLVA